MTEKEIDLQDVLKELRNIIGDQAQQIAILKAAISTMHVSESDSASRDI
jgi:hypothetical protein